MTPRVVIEPAVEPVTLTEAKKHLRLEVNDDDADVMRMIVAARQHIEKVCWRGLVAQTLELTLPGFYEQIADSPAWSMRFFRQDRPVPLPGGHLTAVDELPTESPALTTPVRWVKYLDAAEGALQTLSPSAYEVDSAARPGALRPIYGGQWPDTLDRWNAVTIRYVVGWKAASVPGALKQAILLLVSQMYEHRTPEVSGTIIARVNFSVNSLTEPFRFSRVW